MPMPKLDLNAIPQTNATGYPPEYAVKVAGRVVNAAPLANIQLEFTSTSGKINGCFNAWLSCSGSTPSD
jgi:CO dehydrogenase/acetyl-CoA synthase delta subunit